MRIQTGTAKVALREQRSQLDPVALLHQLRELQGGFALPAGRAAPEDVLETGLDQFLQALPTLWEDGEARPTHKNRSKPLREWRTRVDPFKEAWDAAEKFLKGNPEANGREFLNWLCERHPNPLNPASQLKAVR